MEEAMKKRSVSVILTAAMILTALSGCDGNNGSSTSNTTGNSTATEAAQTIQADVENSGAADYQKLRVQSMPNFNGVLLSYIQDHKWAEEIGLELDVELYASGAPANEALAADLWDVGFQGPAYVFGSVNNDAKIIATVSDTGGDTLFVRGDSNILSKKGFNPTYPDILGDTDTVKGTTILYSAGTSTHQLALSYLEAMGVSADEVSMVPMDFQTCEQTFLIGQGDIVALPTPWSTTVTGEHGWLPVAVLQDFSSTNTDLICSAKAYENLKPELTAFLKLCYRAADALEADKELKVQQIMKFYSENGLEVTEESARKEADLRIFITTDAARGSIDYGKAETDAAEFFESIGQIEADQAERFKENIKTDILKEALGN